MKTNELGLDIIKYFEGLRLNKYRCPGGYNTIGYGHKILPHESYEVITNSKAEELLIEDVKKMEKSMDKLIEVDLSSNQYSAITSFVYNLGATNFANSTLLKKINLNQHLDVPGELIKWIYSGKEKLLGLLRRRIEEANLYVK